MHTHDTAIIPMAKVAATNVMATMANNTKTSYHI